VSVTPATGGASSHPRGSRTIGLARALRDVSFLVLVAAASIWAWAWVSGAVRDGAIGFDVRRDSTTSETWCRRSGALPTVALLERLERESSWLLVFEKEGIRVYRRSSSAGAFAARD
jgi:hypothetical protein